MKTFDIILLTDTPNHPEWGRGYGAHAIASHLRKNKFTVLVLDFSSALTFELWEEICNYAVGENTKMVGFSSTWWPYRKPNAINLFADREVSLQNLDPDLYSLLGDFTEDNGTLINDILLNKMQRWVDVVKSKNPKTKITLGGPKIDWYIDLPVDNFIDGYAETEIIDYLTDTRRIWPKVINHDTAAMSRDWGWTTSSTKYTELDQLHHSETLTLEIARGCRFKCAFCAYPLIGRKDYASYTKQEEVVYAELLENYEKWGVTNYWIGDDTFNDSTEKLEMMVRVTKRLPVKLSFRAYIRLDIIAKQPQQIQMLYDIGLRSCWIGIETFHPVASKVIGKGMSEEIKKKTLYDIYKIWKDDVVIKGGYIVGLPDEDEEFLNKQLEWFASENCPVNHGVTFIPLAIWPKDLLKNVPMSEISKNPAKFGYTFPDPKIPYHWSHDGAGVKTFSQARTLATQFNHKLSTAIKKTIPNTVLHSNLSIRDPKSEYFLPLIEMLKQNKSK